MSEIYEFEHEEGAYYGNTKAFWSFYSSACKKFGSWIGVREVDHPDIIDYVKKSWRIPYIYKPNSKRVERYNKRKEIKKLLGNRKILYKKARMNKSAFLMSLTTEDKQLLKRNFGSEKKFFTFVNNVDRYNLQQRKLDEYFQEVEA